MEPESSIPAFLRASRNEFFKSVKGLLPELFSRLRRGQERVFPVSLTLRQLSTLGEVSIPSGQERFAHHAGLSSGDRLCALLH